MKERETGRPCLISWPFKAQLITGAAFYDFVSFGASFFQPKAFSHGFNKLGTHVTYTDVYGRFSLFFQFQFIFPTK